MKYTEIFFDLDGTLTDPFEGITKSVQHSLEYFDIHIADRNELKCFIGPPLWESYMKYYGFTKEDADEAVRRYREYFSVTGLFENEVYEGIHTLLQELKDKGLRLSVATSKPAIFSQKILDKFDISQYFDFLSGSELDGTRVNKAEVIEYAISSLGITDRSSILMIGDRLHDIEGAHKCGVDACGVLWGYGDRAEHIDCGADYIAETLDELKEIILQ
ncbi:MAG: HAD family hydrolase [Clostridia bacterium]|nr:HAD family hydrolase [Clostridia bacterium]